MHKDTAYLNKVIKRKDYERSMQYHLESIRNIKPITRPIQGNDVLINNKKKQYNNEIRFTEIQRQNRILLEKISSIMNKTKRGSFHSTNKSLNSTYRKRQNQDIEVENARFLKRLQQQRANYDTDKLNKEWIKQKNVMKIMSNYPFVLNDRSKQKRNSMSYMDKRSTIGIEPIEMLRVRVISGITFLITLQLSGKMLKIIADCKERKQVKVIEIQRGQAIQFIEEECQGKLQQIFNHLRYDKQESILYLVGNEVELDQLIAKERQNYGKNYEKNVRNKQKEQVNRQQNENRKQNPENNISHQDQQQIQEEHEQLGNEKEKENQQK